MTGEPSPAPFHRGLAELARYLHRFEDAALRRAIDAFRSATALAPDDPSRWVALGFSLDAAGRAEGALTAFRRAAELDPDDHEVEVFILTLASESGPEHEALAAVEALAERRGIDLDSLRRELAEVGSSVDSGTLILNGFIRARPFLRSRLEDEIERAEHGSAPEHVERRRDDEVRQCIEVRNEVRRAIQPDRVPAELREVTPWAGRLGVGDDVCRRWLAERLTDAERSSVLRTVDQHASLIHAWLDGFDSAAMSREAAAFMYLLLCVEEMGSGHDGG